LYEIFTLTVNAVALSDAIFLPSEKVQGQVKSIHNDYVNIVIPNGIITLVRAGMAHIPFGIEVEIDGGWFNAGLIQNQPVMYDGDAIVLDKAMIVTGLKKCPRFSCKPAYSPIKDRVDLLARLQYLHGLCNSAREVGGIRTYLGQYDAKTFCDSTTSPQLFENRIAERVKALISGILQNDEFLMIKGICGLLGVGPGSTPSGDDFLLGFWSGMMCAEHDSCKTALEKMAYHMLENAKELTTFLSIEYIRYGVKGAYHQYFSELISAFVAGTEEEMVRKANALMTLGHSSGLDLLIGFVYGGFTALLAGVTVEMKGAKNEHL